jgi:putative endonuclease
MQEVGGSIPPGSTTLRLRLRVAQPRKSPKAKRGARRSPQGEDGLEDILLRCGLARVPMWYVYIIRSVNFPEQEYIGASADLKRRRPEHNAGKSTHTAKFKPWQLVWYCAFPDKYKALEFEKYLKSHSDRGFAKKRL